MATHRWIPVTEQMPPFTNSDDVRGGEKSTDIVDVKYDDDSVGEGLFRDNAFRSSWMTREGEEGFLFNLAWSGKNVTHWKPKGWIVNE